VSLAIGARLGAYEILAPLGAGGMGEVYHARDSKLDRFVAIKVLPAQLAENTTALARFEREAKAVAALSHPNILAIFDFGRDATTVYAVMELLDGETLRQKLAAPVPVRKAVEYGVQIARGLAAAHAKGIVHRDLKPENVFVTADGRVKILDFGLARQTLAFAAADATVSPTIERHTDPGTVLGTVGYMSPEQARGEPGDQRSDLFSLGAVLYELVSGRRAFQRDTAAETLTAILREDPPELTSAATAGVPPALVRVVQHCLEKNPAERFQSASDVAFALENLTGSGATAAQALTAKPSSPRAWLAWSVAVLFALASGALLLMNLRAPKPAAPVTRLSAQLPKDLPYRMSGGPSRGLAISPDGLAIFYVGGMGRGLQQIYRRSLDRRAVEPVAGTEGAYQPFLSPDGQWIAFFTIAGELKKVPRDGGPSVILVRGLKNGQWGFGVWRSDDVIVFSTLENLLQVPAAGGMPTALTTVDAAAHESFHDFPLIVPGTGDILFTVTDDYGKRRLDLLRWDTRERSTVVADTKGIASGFFTVLTSSGHLVFSQDDTLMAAPYDAKRRTVGPAVALTEPVVMDSTNFGAPQLAVSPTGTMAYVPPNADEPLMMAGWVDRMGTFTEIGPFPKGANPAALSPDGNVAAVQAGRRLLLFDLARRVMTPVEAPTRPFDTVTWHPDGRRLTLGGAYLSLFDPDTGKETKLTDIGRPKRVASWSPDGRTVAYMTFNPGNDIYVLSLDAAAGPRPIVATDAIENNPAISPDGHWMAYTATGSGDVSGRNDVYVVRFPEGTGKVQITNSGGGAPFWSHDGRELFFPAPPGILQAVSIAGGDRLQVGAPRTLFPMNNLRVNGISPDGKRFFSTRLSRIDPPTEVIVAQNWLQELNRLVPTSK
jgi:hypothetical protein